MGQRNTSQHAYATLPELAFRARDVRAWIAARRDLDR